MCSGIYATLHFTIIQTNELLKNVLHLFQEVVFAARTSITAALHLHDQPVTIHHELALDVTQSFVQSDANSFLPLCPVCTLVQGALLCPTRQRASMKCPDWRLTQSIRSTSCLVESVPRGLKMESSRATPCHLDRVDLGAGLSARTAECMKRCTTTFKYCLSFWESYFFYYFFSKKAHFHTVQSCSSPRCFLFILPCLRSGNGLFVSIRFVSFCWLWYSLSAIRLEDNENWMNGKLE